MRALPGITVVVPVTNFYTYADRLKLCLASITKQTCDEYDVILSYMGDELHFPHFYDLTVVAEPAQEQFMPALIRNIGARWARRQYVTFVDADAVLHPHALEASIDACCPETFTTITTAMTSQKVDDPAYWGALEDVDVFNRLAHEAPKAPGTGCCTTTTTVDFNRARGFHEGMIGYGPTDWEFTGRLAGNGFEQKDLSAMYGIYNLHQNHDRPFQDKDPENVPSRKRNRAVLEESMRTDGLTRNGPRWGGC